VTLLLWYMNSYSETTGALREVCTLIAGEVSATVKKDAGGTPANDLNEASSVCDQKAAL
jgi:hypothetical protein